MMQVEAVEGAVQAGDAAGVHAAALQLLDAAETIGAASVIDTLRPLVDAAAGGSLPASASDMAARLRQEVDSTVAFWSHIEIDES